MSAALMATIGACTDDEITTPATTGDAGYPADSSTTDSGGDSATPSTKGNVRIKATYMGPNAKGTLSCLVLGDQGPVRDPSAVDPSYPAELEANNIDPGDYGVICFIDTDGDGRPQELGPVGPPGEPAPVTVKAGETTDVDVMLIDIPPMDDGGADGGDAGDGG